MRGWPGTSVLPLILAAAIAIHNAEEVLTLPSYPQFLRWPVELGLLESLPSLATLQWGVAAFAVVPALILYRAWAKPTPRLAFVTAMIGAMTAFNALLPHIAGALWTGGYVPGLVSAVGLTLPIGLFTLWRSASVDALGKGKAAMAAVVGVLLLPLVLVGFWALNELILELS